MQVSAKTGENINELFNEVGKLIVDSYLPNRITENSGMLLSKPESSPKKKNDCQCWAIISLNKSENR